jgi:hypothetical protein
MPNRIQRSTQFAIAMILVNIAHVCAAEPSVAKIDVLVVNLKNANAAPTIEKGIARFPNTYDWEAQKRVLSAWEQLHSRFEEALPTLVTKLWDKNYCATVKLQSADAEQNLTVGEVSEYLVRLNIEPYTRIHRKFLLSFDDRKIPQHRFAIDIWFKERTHKSLRELQLETIEWQIERYRPEYYQPVRVSQERIDSEFKKLKMERDELRTDSKLKAPPKWHDDDELTFPTR